jgi:hypothetical protein
MGLVRGDCKGITGVGFLMDLATQAKTVRAILPEADVRTDQCDVLRVYLHSTKLMGAIDEKNGQIRWSITDLKLEGEVSWVTAPPVLEADASDELEAAALLARELKRMHDAQSRAI